MAKEAERALQEKFRNDTGNDYITVKVTGFKKGSTIIQYDVNLSNLTNDHSKLLELDEKLEMAATEWTTPILNATVNQTRTKDLLKSSLLQKICTCPEAYRCNNLSCQHVCDSKKMSCGDHGQCVFDRKSQKPSCHCINSKNDIFYGENCTHIVPRTTAIPDPFPVSKLTIIAISGGTGGALLLIILISTICFCYRLKQAKRNGSSFSETSSKCESDIIRDNKKMESIPLESGKLNPGYQDHGRESEGRYPLEHHLTTKSNPIYEEDLRDTRKVYQNDQEPRYQDHDNISRGSFNLQTSSNRPRAESYGNRQPVKKNYFNDPEPSNRDQRESENSYRPRGFGNERNNARERPGKISRDRNNSRGWSEESSNDRDKPMGRSEEFNDERNNTRRWPEETGSDRNFRRGRSEQGSIDGNKYVYIEGDGGVRRLFKRVDDEELGGEPSNLPRPIQRENVDSVGVNFIMRPAPSQDERRSSLYDRIDSESPKIDCDS